jgi:hypothetical protein
MGMNSTLFNNGSMFDSKGFITQPHLHKWSVFINLKHTVFDDADVANDDVSHRYMDYLSRPDHRIFKLQAELFLEATELHVLAPVDKSGNKHDNNDGDHDSDALDVSGSSFGRIACLNAPNLIH